MSFSMLVIVHFDLCTYLAHPVCRLLSSLAWCHIYTSPPTTNIVVGTGGGGGGGGQYFGSLIKLFQCPPI